MNAAKQAGMVLRRQYTALIKHPVANIVARPNDKNILECHYVITGPQGTPYEGGQYHGVLKFPEEFPYKPPAIMMLTPNGRFSVGQRLCLSISDFHPDQWKPIWSIETVLVGLLSFMLEDTQTVGSIATTDAVKRALAAQSAAFNANSPTFCRIFPDLVAAHQAAAPTSGGASGGATVESEAGAATVSTASAPGVMAAASASSSWTSTGVLMLALGIFTAIFSLILAFL